MTNISRRKSLAAAGAIGATCVAFAILMSLWLKASAAPNPSSAIQLRNGWKLTPSGRLIELSGDMPLKIVTSADGREAFIVTGGFHDHGLEAIDLGASRIVQRINLGKAWAGLALDEPGGVLYVAGGGPAPGSLSKRPDLQGIDAKLAESLSLPVLRLELKSGRLAAGNGMVIPGLDEKDRFTAGLATTSKALFVANTQNDTIYKLDRENGGLQGSAKVGYRPYQIAASPDGTTVAVGEWGDGSVLLLRTDLSQVGRVKVGTHPTDVAYGPDGRLFVANAGSDSVSIIGDARVTETVRTDLSSTGPIGATPCSLAVSRDGNRLYVANSGENDVAVIDIAHPGHAAVLGFIPTGQYPSAVAVTRTGEHWLSGSQKVSDRGRTCLSAIPPPAPRPIQSIHSITSAGWSGDMRKSCRCRVLRSSRATPTKPAPTYRAHGQPRRRSATPRPHSDISNTLST